MSRRQHYYAYKKPERMAEQAVQNGEFLKAERYFLEAAAARLHFRDTHCNGVWDDGHEARYHICVGAAWIQRQAYEDDRIIDAISYEREMNSVRRWSVWEKKHKSIGKESFNSLIKKHAQLKKRRNAKK